MNDTTNNNNQKERAKRNPLGGDRVRQMLAVSEKGDLGATKKESEATDFVTIADEVCQDVITALLKKHGFCDGRNVTVVGEEEEELESTNHQQSDCDGDGDGEGGAPQRSVRATHAAACVAAYEDKYIHHRVEQEGGGSNAQLSIPFFQETLKPLLLGSSQNGVVVRGGGGGGGGVARRVGVFIDPIDGTNAFVKGVMRVPMTLVGIAVDGIPVAAVANRVFVRSSTSSSSSNSSLRASLSYCINLGGVSFAVVDGALRQTQTQTQTTEATTATTTLLEQPLRVALSRTTRDEVNDALRARLPQQQQQLSISSIPLNNNNLPVDLPGDSGSGTVPVYARGAGFKLMLLVTANAAEEEEDDNGHHEEAPRAASGVGPSPASDSAAAAAEVFMASPSAIHKWDTCAPHAFLRCLGDKNGGAGCGGGGGGDIFDFHGRPIRYHVTTTTASTTPSTSSSVKHQLTALPDGVVAVRGAAMAAAVSAHLAVTRAGTSAAVTAAVD